MKNKLIELVDALREELTPNAYIKIANAIHSLPDDESDLLPFQWPIPEGMEAVTGDERKVGQLVKIESGQSDKTKVEEQLRSLVGVLDGQIHTWFSHGNCAKCCNGMVHSYKSDLFLRRVEKKVWVVEWSDIGRSVFYSKLEALNWIDSQDNEATIYEATLKPVK